MRLDAPAFDLVVGLEDAPGVTDVETVRSLALPLSLTYRSVSELRSDHRFDSAEPFFEPVDIVCEADPSQVVHSYKRCDGVPDGAGSDESPVSR